MLKNGIPEKKLEIVCHRLLLDGIGKWDEAALTRYCTKLFRSANNQVDLLYTLLNWAQIQSGRVPYLPSLFNLPEVVRSTVEIVQTMADDKGVTLDVQMPEQAIVTGDYIMLNTVVRNLLTNAVKFTPKGGTVGLDVETNYPSLQQRTRITISDTGVGMSEVTE